MVRSALVCPRPKPNTNSSTDTCVIEIRAFTGDALRAEIVAISDADAGVLRGRLEEHYSNIRQAKVADAQRHLGRNG